LVELEQVDVREVEPLGAMDGEDRDRVLPALARPSLLCLLRLGDAPAQQAEDPGDVAAPLFERRQELAEEAVEVGQAVGPEIAGRLRGLEQEEPAQALDETVRRVLLP